MNTEDLNATTDLPRTFPGRFPVLSVKGPWIQLIGGGLKTIELRTWKMPKTIKGKVVLLHRPLQDDNRYLAAITKTALDTMPVVWQVHPRGCVVMATELGECIDYRADPERFREEADKHCCNPSRGVSGHTADLLLQHQRSRSARDHDHGKIICRQIICHHYFRCKAQIDERHIYGVG